MRLTESVVKSPANYELVHGAYEKVEKSNFWSREEFFEMAVDYNKAKMNERYEINKALGMDIWGRKL